MSLINHAGAAPGALVGTSATAKINSCQAGIQRDARDTVFGNSNARFVEICCFFPPHSTSCQQESGIIIELSRLSYSPELQNLPDAAARPANWSVSGTLLKLLCDIGRMPRGGHWRQPKQSSSISKSHRPWTSSMLPDGTEY